MAGHEASLLHLEKDLGVEDDISMLSDKVMKELLVPHQEKCSVGGQPLSELPPVKAVVPCPGFCLKTKTDKNEKVFVNICRSGQIPSPKDITDEQLQSIMESGDAVNYRVPLSLGEPREETDNAGKECMVYDVIVSDHFYDIVEKRPVMKNFLLTIVLEGLEDKYNLRLCRDCRILKNRNFFGAIPAEQTVREKPKPFIIDMDKENGLTSLSKEGNHKSLIPEPDYSIVREPVEGAVPEFLVFEAKLLNVTSSRSITLDIGEDRIVLAVRPNLYYLDIDLPFTVDANESGAQFDKETHVLTVTVPVTGEALY